MVIPVFARQQHAPRRPEGQQHIRRRQEVVLPGTSGRKLPQGWPCPHARSKASQSCRSQDARRRLAVVHPRTPTRRRLAGWPREQRRLGNFPTVVAGRTFGDAKGVVHRRTSTRGLPQGWHWRTPRRRPDGWRVSKRWGESDALYIARQSPTANYQYTNDSSSQISISGWPPLEIR